jgi:hypothetical protein
MEKTINSLAAQTQINRKDKYDSVGLWHGERIYSEGNPGTGHIIWPVSGMEKGIIERDIQGPTPGGLVGL